jgi:hypothetical protein
MLGRSTPSYNEYDDDFYGYENGTDILVKGIYLDLSYSLYGHSLFAALFSMSLIQPDPEPCARLYRKPCSLGSNDIMNELAVGLVLPTRMVKRVKAEGFILFSEGEGEEAISTSPL